MYQIRRVLQPGDLALVESGAHKGTTGMVLLVEIETIVLIDDKDNTTQVCQFVSWVSVVLPRDRFQFDPSNSPEASLNQRIITRLYWTFQITNDLTLSPRSPLIILAGIDVDRSLPFDLQTRVKVQKGLHTGFIDGLCSSSRDHGRRRILLQKSPEG
ncbi:hypothetical protein K474DRAFT_1663569 [Panus rudis PR-1116 ss-1]|nr:hypothetical protein K474DRAFT_1663569 [Panus rudis PR-1116 ss-1]